ncbi:MAG: hypothetical protein EPN85_11745 [Bacteroidetes bacterium]|nr:MAG: hypothetical protein EPN85_11745 [Bacteroidota bacterium]
MCRIREYFSLFFLSLFVFPYVQKGIHDLEHASEVHCTDKLSTHLHEFSHTCSLCDYTIGKELSTVSAVELGFEEFTTPFLFSEIEDTPFESVKYLFLLRAPPVLS